MCLIVPIEMHCTVISYFVITQTCQVSRISHETHAFLMSLTLSLDRTVEMSRISCSTKNNIFNVTSVLLLW